MRREGRADLNMGRKSPDLTILLIKYERPLPPRGCFLPHSKDFSSMVLGPLCWLPLEVNEEGPDFLGVHSDDGVSW